MSMTPKNAKIEPEKHIWTVEIFPALLGRHERNLLEDMGRRRLRRHKRQLQMLHYPIHDGNLRDEGDDLHPAPAFRADHRVHLIDLPDHGRPTFGRKTPELFLNDPERRRTLARLLDLPPMGVRIKAEVSDHHLTLVGNMRGHPGDKYVAVDVEAGVRPRENALGPLRAQQLLADKHRQNLAGEDLGEPRVVDPRDLMEDARLVHSALGHQVMEMGVEINPVPKGLDG